MKKGLAAWLALFSFGFASFQSPVRAEDAVTMNNAGWTFVTEQDPQSLLSRVQIVVRSGGLSDPAQLPGLAHFTARALLRGTKTRPFKDLTESIERLGASLAVRVDQDRTYLDGVVLSQNLDGFLDLLRDVLTQPAFDTKELLALQNMVQGELKVRLQDSRTLAARGMLKLAYRGTLAENYPLGTVRSVGRITPQDVDRFFRARYVRENIVVGVTSPFTRDQIVAKLASKLDSVPQGAVDAPAVPTPSLQGRRAMIVERKGMSTIPLFIAVNGVGEQDADLMALRVGNFVFGADFTSRLMQILRAENGWTYGAYSGFSQILQGKKEPGLFSLYTFPSAEFAALAIPKALSLLEEYSQAGVTEAEFEDARGALGLRYAFELDTAEKRLDLRMREVLNGHPNLSPEQYRAGLTSLRLEGVNRTISQKVKTEDLAIVAVGDPMILKPILSSLPGVESVEVIDVEP